MATILDVSVPINDLTPSTFTVSAGSNRKLYLFSCFNSAGGQMTDVQYGGQMMTELASTTEAQNRRAYLFMLPESGIAAATDSIFSITWANQPAAARTYHVVVSVEDAPQTQEEVALVDSDGEEPQTVQFTDIPANAQGFALAYNNDATNQWTWINGWTERHDQSITGGTASFAQQTLSAGNNTVSANPDDGSSANHLIAMYVPPIVTPSTVTLDSFGVGDFRVVYDNELRVTVAGTNFGGTQGSGTVQLHDSDPDEGTPSTSVTQTIRTWSDTSITMDIDKGAISGDEAWLEVTEDGGDSSSFAVTVRDDTGTAPAVRTTPSSQSFTQGQDFSLDASQFIHHSDAQDELSFTATGLPEGISITPEGVVSGTLADGTEDNSPYSVQVTATDQDGGNISDTFNWTVSASTEFGDAFPAFGDWRMYRLRRWLKWKKSDID